MAKVRNESANIVIVGSGVAGSLMASLCASLDGVVILETGPSIPMADPGWWFWIFFLSENEKRGDIISINIAVHRHRNVHQVPIINPANIIMPGNDTTDSYFLMPLGNIIDRLLVLVISVNIYKIK